MKSMTGFGQGQFASDTMEVSIEVSAVNKKSLDLFISSPRDWLSLEPFIGEVIRKTPRRGRISIAIRVKKCAQVAALEWDEESLFATINKLRDQAFSAGYEFDPNADTFLRVAMSQQSSSSLPEWQKHKESIGEALESALKEFDTMRIAEGDNLQKDFEQRVQTIRQIRSEIEKASEGTVEKYKERLMERLRSMDLELDLEDERLLKEVALFADKCDINEEIIRLESHAEQLEAIILEKGLIGRKIEFLLQEVSREFNTIGSKANNIEISKFVIEAKNELEAMREQVANIE